MAVAAGDDWDATDSEPARARPVQLVLDLDGFGGPLDVLLALARDQKVDLRQISILKLADQYIEFISGAHRIRLEVAADYLVMAAWLAYLKSRLLLPDEPANDDEPTGPELAEALTFQLRRLEAMREAGARLMALPRLGQEVFPRGAPEGVEVIRHPVYKLALYDLLKAYGDQYRRKHTVALEIEPSALYSLDDALHRLRHLVGETPDWEALEAFLPVGLRDPLLARSALASTFAAGLEMTREGVVEMRQSSPFGPIFIKARVSP